VRNFNKCHPCPRATGNIALLLAVTAVCSGGQNTHGKSVSTNTNDEFIGSQAYLCLFIAFV